MGQQDEFILDTNVMKHILMPMYLHKKFFFFRTSVKFLGHIINQDGVSTNANKVEGITKMTSTDPMDSDVEEKKRKGEAGG